MTRQPESLLSEEFGGPDSSLVFTLSFTFFSPDIIIVPLKAFPFLPALALQCLGADPLSRAFASSIRLFWGSLKASTFPPPCLPRAGRVVVARLDSVVLEATDVAQTSTTGCFNQRLEGFAMHFFSFVWWCGRYVFLDDWVAWDELRDRKGRLSTCLFASLTMCAFLKSN